MQLQPTAPDFANPFAARALNGAEGAADRGAGFAALLQQSQTAAPVAPPPATAPVAPPAPQPTPPPAARAPTTPPRAKTSTDADDAAAEAPVDAAAPADAASGPPPGDAAAAPAPATPADLARTLLRAKLRNADGNPATKAAKGAKPEAANDEQLVVVGKSKLSSTSPVQVDALPTPLPGVLPEVASLPRPDAAASGGDATSAAPSLAKALAARPEVSAKDAAATAVGAPAEPPPTAAADAAGFAAMLSEQKVEAAAGAPSRSTAIDGAAPAGPAAGAFGTTPIAGAAAPTPVDLPTPVASPDFSRHLGMQVSVLAKDGVQQAELHLNPADMGPVSVQITLDGTQARIDFGADVAATRHAIEAGLPQLAGALADAGFTLAGGGVSQHAGGQAGGSGPRDDTRGDSGRGVTAGGVGEAPARGVAPRSVRVGGLDLYA